METDEQHTISAVIVSYNTRDLIKQCIDSIRKDAGVSVEIIVVDNASEDGTQQMLREEYPDVHLIENPGNYGFAKANNIGFRASSGEFVFLVNSDTIIPENTFGALRDKMLADEKIGVLGPKLLFFDDSLQLSCKKFPSFKTVFNHAFFLHRLFPGSYWWADEEMPASFYEKESEADVVSGAFMCVRRKALEAVGGLDESFFFYGEDVDWCRRFRVGGWKVVYTPDVWLYHLEGGSSKKNPGRYSLLLRKAKCQNIEKHSSVVGTILTKLMLITGNMIRLGLSLVLLPFRRKRAVYMMKTNFGPMVWTIKTLFRSYRRTGAKRFAEESFISPVAANQGSVQKQ